jgi:hypothetical protein
VALFHLGFAPDIGFSFLDGARAGSIACVAV